MDKYVKLEEMKYVSNSGKYSILAFGVYKGRHFFIVNVGGQWPTAYVEARPGEERDSMEDLLCGEKFPHGGLTYGPEDLLHLKKARPAADIGEGVLALKYWGWDYGHLGDYCAWMGGSTYRAGLWLDEDLGVKYTTDEIYENDVVPFIEWINQEFSNKQNSGGENK